MALDYSTLLSGALALSVEERVQLVDAITESLDLAADFEVDPEWAAELDRRIQLAESGQTQGIPTDEVFRELRERFAKR